MLRFNSHERPFGEAFGGADSGNDSGSVDGAGRVDRTRGHAAAGIGQRITQRRRRESISPTRVGSA
jgi:hypothetical protein